MSGRSCILADGRELGFMDPLPESVWALLPGGYVAEERDTGECWQYMGTVSGYPHGEPRALPVSAWGGILPAAPIVHQFRHRMHPAYDGERVYCEVTDGDAGPRVTRLTVGGSTWAEPAPAFVVGPTLAGMLRRGADWLQRETGGRW